MLSILVVRNELGSFFEVGTWRFAKIWNLQIGARSEQRMQELEEC